FALAFPNGERFTYRTTTGGQTTATGSGATNYPNTWLRLTRVGNVFTGYRSDDGTNWAPLAAGVNIAMPNILYLGLAVTSHNPAGSAFNDATAPAGVTSFYRVTAMDDAGHESTGFAATSALRPANQAATIKINFQLAGSPTVAGYLQDNGFAFADHGGLQYGW